MFIANVDCTIAPHAGNDVYGKPKHGAPVKARCAMVKMAYDEKKTSVRADSSASRGNAEEIVADARLLFIKTTVIQMDDLVTVAGYQLRVIGVFPRYTVQGRLDHWQVDCSIWK